MSNEDTLGIGSTVWKFDDNRRSYHPRGSIEAAQSVGPIFRHKFVRYQIVDETPRSWLVGFVDGEPGDGSGEGRVSRSNLGKMPKSRTLPTTRVRPEYYTTQEMEDAIFLHDNRNRIAEQVRQENDIAKIRAIAEILNYIPKL